VTVSARYRGVWNPGTELPRIGVFRLSGGNQTKTSAPGAGSQDRGTVLLVTQGSGGAALARERVQAHADRVNSLKKPHDSVALYPRSLRVDHDSVRKLQEVIATVEALKQSRLVEVLLPMLLLVLTVVGAGCETARQNFCPGCLDADNGPGKCSDDGDCLAPMGVCDLGVTNLCVVCTTAEAGACSGATPACIANTCQKCTAHAQCKVSGACLPDGSCADVTQVAYVQEGGLGKTCTRDAPCGILDEGVSVTRPYVKIQTGTVTADDQTMIDGKTVTILADPGAKLSRAGMGTILAIRGTGTDVAIFDLELTGATGTGAAIAILNGGAPKLTLTHVLIDGNDGIGIDATAGSLTLSRSTVVRNKGGGLSIVSTKFDVTNNMIVDNGDDGAGGGTATVFGGVLINQIPSGNRRFDFNTVSNNKAAAGLTTGVACIIIPAVTFSGNIVFNNQNGAQLQVNTIGNCLWTFSDIGASPSGVMGGVSGNMNVDPDFVSPERSDYHLQPTTQVKDAADPSMTADPDIDVDIDGDRRPQGTFRDIGADEIKQ